MFSVPNLLTIFRLLLMPLVVAAFFLPVEWSHLAAGWLFLIASVTDLLDGWIARLFAQETPFGAFLDPIADKVMVLAVLILLVQVHQNFVFTLCAVLIASREIAVSALRAWLASATQEQLGVSLLGKVKTFAQMFSLTLLLANAKAMYEFWGIIALAIFYLSTLLSIVSMVSYFKDNWSALTTKNTTGE